jgi:hypothetical protein
MGRVGPQFSGRAWASRSLRTPVQQGSFVSGPGRARLKMLKYSSRKRLSPAEQRSLGRVPADAGGSRPSPCSLGLSATSQQYFSLTTNQPPATSQQYSSLRTNQHQPPATSQPNRLLIFSALGYEPTTRSQKYGERRRKSFDIL